MSDAPIKLPDIVMPEAPPDYLGWSFLGPLPADAKPGVVYHQRLIIGPSQL